MIQCLSPKALKGSIPILSFTESSFAKEIKKLPHPVQVWAKENGFKGKSRTLCLVPQDSTISHVLYGASEGSEASWDGAFLAKNLPVEKSYHLENQEPSKDFALAWALASYAFHADKNTPTSLGTLCIPQSLDLKSIEAFYEAIELTRTLINTPANLLTPETLSQKAEDLAKKHGAQFKEIVGEDLLKENYPLIHAVGRAGHWPPRLIHVSWGDPKNTRIALVGKGITFDTGGLNIKTGHYMNLMKKDMGGAAHAMALAHLIMAHNLPLCLDLYLPVAENAIAGNATRPGDIVNSRSGLSIEIADTDAEGRLVLADALTRACEASPNLIIDFATLTGAARVALGAEVPALFGNTKHHVDTLTDLSTKTQDPLWALPLWQDYRSSLQSTVADMRNIGTSAYGDAITAALFLEKFVESTPWLHVDLMAWSLRARPGRPIGGEAQSLKTFFAFLKENF